jgi:prophage regulatory protein
MNEKLLTKEEVCEMVGIKPSTLYLYIKEKHFPKPKKIGKLSRWKLSDVRRWIEELN